MMCTPRYFFFAAVGYSQELTIKFESTLQVETVLSDPFNKRLKSLTIKVEDNRKIWYSYGAHPWQSDLERHVPSFRIRREVDSLPDLKNLTGLEALTINFLGLKQLPQGIGELKKIRFLDISFNFIKVADEIETIKKLPNLEDILIFGLNFTKSDLETLKSMNSGIKVWYTKEHDLELLRKRREE